MASPLAGSIGGRIGERKKKTKIADTNARTITTDGGKTNSNLVLEDKGA
jgi:hypothetical protein